MNEQKPAPRAGLYDRDLYAWSIEQAKRLRVLKPDHLDWENIAEEIESLGRSDKRAIGTNLRVIVEHLLKWRFQQERRSKSWQLSITEHRHRLKRRVSRSIGSFALFLSAALARFLITARKHVANSQLPTAAFIDERKIFPDLFFRVPDLNRSHIVLDALIADLGQRWGERRRGESILIRLLDGLAAALREHNTEVN